MKKLSLFLTLALMLFVFVGCESNPTKNNEKTLPYLGKHEFQLDSDGNVIDTIYYTIPKFAFINQDSILISHNDYEGHIYVVDFFFTSCPSICPVMSGQMSRLQSMLAEENLLGNVMLLSHTVDPSNDKPAVLKAYAEARNADFRYWNFVTGSTEDLYYQAENGYMMTAFPSDTAQGGFFHSDNFVLVDRSFHIRGIYDGTSTKSVNTLFEDIQRLNNEK